MDKIVWKKSTSLADMQISTLSFVGPDHVTFPPSLQGCLPD